MDSSSDELKVPAGLLHWFTSPYVRRLVFDRSSGTVDVHTWSVFARPQEMRIHLSEIRYPNTLRPQVTFQVSGYAALEAPPSSTFLPSTSCFLLLTVLSGDADQMQSPPE